MTAPEPRANPLLVGHAAHEAVLLDALRSGRMHHAWLIAGPAGIGKATLAFRFARRLLAGMPGPGETLALDPAHPVFRRVAAGSHADLLTVERAYDEKRKRTRTQIAVDDVREINGFMRLTPAEGGWRVVVVDGAEDMNQNAANALLKVLEEPPPRAVLLLVCAAPGRLLPTIRSRCRRLRLSPLGEADMDRLLAALSARHGDGGARPARGARRGLARAGAGAGRGGGAAPRRAGGRGAGANCRTLRPARGYEVADALGRSEDRVLDVHGPAARVRSRSAVREAVRGRADAEQARLVAARPLDAWGDVWHALTRLQDETERFNLDKRQAILSSLSCCADPHRV